jgi:hypothetical protein
MKLAKIPPPRARRDKNAEGQHEGACSGEIDANVALSARPQVWLEAGRC